MITISMLYCVIAVTLRKQDKALRGSSVHQKDQRKQQAIKMTLCVIAAFYICNLPFMVMHVLDESECSSFKVLWAFIRSMSEIEVQHDYLFQRRLQTPSFKIKKCKAKVEKIDVENY